MKPEIIGQLCNDSSTIVVQVKTAEGSMVKMLNLKNGAISEAFAFSDLVRFNPCEEYTGAAQLEQILETHQLIL